MRATNVRVARRMSLTREREEAQRYNLALEKASSMSVLELFCDVDDFRQDRFPTMGSRTSL